jgi:hypothetical protein
MFAPWTARSLSTEAGGEAGAAAADAGATAAPDAGEKMRSSRGRRDDRPNEDYNPPPIQAVLSAETKSLMYSLHAKDPVANSEAVLAARFGISDLRVRAILMLQTRYHELQKQGALPTAGVEMEQFVERTSGTVKTGFNSPFYQVPGAPHAAECLCLRSIEGGVDVADVALVPGRQGSSCCFLFVVGASGLVFNF